MTADRARHVVLVHGSYHGPWCWERLIPELEARGHRVTAVDLPISDPAAGALAYADAIEAQVEWREPPIVVGHSMAGLVIPIVATRRAVRQLVFLAAALPRIGTSFNEQRAHEPIDAPAPTTAEWTDLGDGVWMVGPATAREVFYGDATPEDAALAIERLRPQAYLAMSERTPLQSWPLVPMAAIWCRADRAFDPGWVRRAARSRLGVEPVAIDGGHSPFITRPAELATTLEGVFV